MADELISHTAPGPQPGPPVPDEKDIKSKISALLTSGVFYSVEQDKTYEYLNIRKNNLHYRGVQNIVFKRDPHDHSVDYRPANEPGTMRLSADQDRRSPYDYSTNVFEGDCKKLIAVLGGKAPNFSAAPLKEGDEHHVSSTRKANEVLSALRDILRVDRWHPYLVYCLGVNGRCFGLIDHEADRNKYGETVEPIIESEMVPPGPPLAACPTCEQVVDVDSPVDPVCPQCLSPLDPNSVMEQPPFEVPVQKGIKSYANGGTRLRLFSGLHVTTDYQIRDLSEASFMKLEYEVDPGQILRLYPQLRGKSGFQTYYHGTGPGTDFSGATGRYVREEMGTATGVRRAVRTGRWLYTCYWFPPSTLEMIDQGNENSPVRDYLLSEYPEGVKMVFVNGELVARSPESITSVWTMCSPSVGEYYNQLPWMQSMVQFQDVLNDITNIAIMLLERSAPYTFINNKLLDIEQMQRQRWFQFIPVADLTQDARNLMYSTNAAKVDPLILNVGEALKENWREGTGMLPPLYGAAGEDEVTRGQAILRRNQAMKMLATLWSNILHFWAETMENAVVQSVKNSVDGQIWMPARSGRRPYPLDFGDMSPLLEMIWLVHPDESIPMSAEEQREYLKELLNSPNPVIPQLLGLDHPANLQVIQQRLLSQTGLKIPRLQMYDRIMGIVRQLVSSAPVPGMDPMTGQPIYQSSVPANPVMFDPVFAFQAVQEWLVSPEGAEAEQAAPEGFQNVLLYAQEYKQIVEGPPPGVMPPPPEEGGGEKKEEVPPTESLPGETPEDRQMATQDPEAAGSVRPGTMIQ